MARVWAAMSGGVDSSVAAALLVEAGHDVTGVTMRLQGEDAPGGCCPSGSVRDAKRVCDLLGIPHYTLDMRDVFDSAVVEMFCEEYAAGRTPNPCIACNDSVKYGELLRRARLQDVDLLATGHYARISVDADGVAWLARAADRAKDQAYFLYRMTPEQLAHAAFPVGDLTKPDVRAQALARGLPTAMHAESQETCFVPDGDVRAFVRGRRPEAFEPGELVDGSGDVVGHHDGAVGFTIGQRKGTGVQRGTPAYVTQVLPGERRVVVGDRADLRVSTVWADHLAWRGGDAPRRVSGQVRYRGQEHRAIAGVEAGRLVVRFDSFVEAVAPGQAVVCRDGDIVLGGGEVGEAR